MAAKACWHCSHVTVTPCIELKKVFSSNRVVSLWNDLPVCTDFTSLRHGHPVYTYLVLLSFVSLDSGAVVDCACRLRQRITIVRLVRLKRRPKRANHPSVLLAVMARDLLPRLMWRRPRRKRLRLPKRHPAVTRSQSLKMRWLQTRKISCRCLMVKWRRCRHTMPVNTVCV